MSVGVPCDGDDDVLIEGQKRYQEMVDHGGQVVARPVDGTEPVYAHGYQELHTKLEELGIPYETVVIGDVPRADEFFANV